MDSRENVRIGEALLKKGLVSEEQLSEALLLQKSTNMKLGDIFVEKSVIQEEDLLNVLANLYQLPTVELDDVILDPKVLALFPFEMLENHKVLPLEIKDQTIVVATNNPLDVLALQEIRYVSGRQVKPVLASRDSIEFHLKKSRDLMESFKSIRQAEGSSADSSIVKIVNSLITRAIKEAASDIHLEPQKDRLRVRFRIDGILFEKMNIPHAIHRKVISRLKIMANLDVTENRKPQEGRISWIEAGQDYDIRLSTLLDINGETISLRILNAKTISHTFDSLGLDEGEIALIKELVHRPHGIFLVTGPTGAGKTTTLYSILNDLNKVSSNIITVEDPVEYQLEGITQTNINLHTGYTFANAIRHILRHDPNIIMVGEVRDIETAEVSVRAALTGHLVLATLHTNSAAGAITRLQEMNVEPFLLGSTVIGVIAQRLVRRLCPHCKVEEKAPEEIKKIIAHEMAIHGSFTIAHPKGCDKCFHTGYSGRVGLFEILKTTKEIRQLILKKAGEEEIQKMLIANGMRTLRKSGYQKVIDKITSYEEVLRVTLTDGV